MADKDLTDAEKAEKLAAARKRVEQMKKKSKKAGTAKKDKQKEEAPAEAAAEVEPEATTSAAADEDASEGPSSPAQTPAPLSQTSQLRSPSFRQGPLSPTLSPDGETAADIYRKQVARIDDLEKENKRLAKEAGDAERRYKKAEDELADLQEADQDGSDNSQIEKLKSEIAALQRQNTQLQSAATKRHGSSPSLAMAVPADELQAQLASKSTTIETMELEISRLRAQAERQATAGGTDREQIVALEEKLARSEQAAMKAQRELTDLKRNLDRAAERVVKEGGARTSAETKVRTLERDIERITAEKTELEKKAEALDKKVAALGTLHKENDSRSQALRKEKERAEKEAQEAQLKIERLEGENLRLRKKDAAEGGGDDEGMDELEGEERQRMEKRIRDLEGEVYDLRRGIWHQRRKEMEPGAEGDFTNIDLDNGPSSSNTTRKTSGKGLGGYLTSGINALAGMSADEQDEFLEDDDMEFDEEAFKRAQQEDAKRRLERIKELKRGLKNWEGWRLDLVDGRRGGGGYGAGEIFEI
ncbi:putative m protein repeat protein [Rosellinia necatrix]|uniref:Putative m protein repeat protein n=1 Tax=Rosellinia necatrix TaxID=77044 RepID=A0A1S7UJ85_ROSNE|nr:putative m protein repeat protein [Rosellinia necatrix]